MLAEHWQLDVTDSQILTYGPVSTAATSGDAAPESRRVAGRLPGGVWPQPPAWERLLCPGRPPWTGHPGGPSPLTCVPPSLFQFWLPDDCWAQASLCLGLQDPNRGDHRPFSFSVLVGHGRSHVFSVELGSELAAWELSFQRATFLDVQRTGVSDSLVSDRTCSGT
eukprot:bmy_18032T0